MIAGYKQQLSKKFEDRKWDAIYPIAMFAACISDGKGSANMQHTHRDNRHGKILNYHRGN